MRRLFPLLPLLAVVFPSPARARLLEGAEMPERLENGDALLVLNGAHQAAVSSGLPFKRAHFGVWISDRSVQKSSKRAMLGRSP